MALARNQTRATLVKSENFTHYILLNKVLTRRYLHAGLLSSDLAVICCVSSELTGVRSLSRLSDRQDSLASAKSLCSVSSDSLGVSS